MSKNSVTLKSQIGFFFGKLGNGGGGDDYDDDVM
jgi:hypothetical protein